MTRYITAVAAGLVLTACDNGAGPMSSEKGRFRDLGPQHAVVVRPEAFADLSPAERAKKERETIDAIVERVPAQFRAEMRTQLEPRAGRDIAFASSADPELARLFGELASLRQANGPRRAAPAQVEDTTIHVILALVPKLDAPGARVSVLRRPNDKGIPIVLLQESDVTKDDILLGLRGAVAAYRRHGAAPEKESKMAVRAKARSSKGAAVPVVDRNVENLKKAALMNIPGVGKVRAQEVVTSLSAFR